MPDIIRDMHDLVKNTPEINKNMSDIIRDMIEIVKDMPKIVKNMPEINNEKATLACKRSLPDGDSGSPFRTTSLCEVLKHPKGVREPLVWEGK